MDHKIIGAILILPLALSGCATAPRSALLGAAIGGTAGALIGQASSQNTTGTVVGAAIGAGVASLIGYSAYKEKEKKELAEKVKNGNPEDIFPSVTKPRIRSYVVPDTIEGNKYIKSHRVFILEDPGSWSKE